VRVRQIRATDAPLLAGIFDQLSDTSRWMQFLAAKKQLSAAELRYLTDVDHHDHEALAALDQTAGRGAGVARYIRHPADRHVAEVAITVIDDWQRRGLGTELLIQLSARARQEGIGRFTAVASADNAAAARPLRTVRANLVSHQYDTVEYEIDLAHPRPGLVRLGFTPSGDTDHRAALIRSTGRSRSPQLQPRAEREARRYAFSTRSNPAHWMTGRRG
jgi:RimJ/RimL family protein N-acetyltransferase